MKLLIIGGRIINPRYIVAYDIDPVEGRGTLTLASGSTPIVIEIDGPEACALAAVLRRQAVDVLAAAALLTPPHTAGLRPVDSTAIR